MKKIGLIIGKFAPLHKGHEYLIETAKEHIEGNIDFFFEKDELMSVVFGK